MTTLQTRSVSDSVRVYTQLIAAERKPNDAFIERINPATGKNTSRYERGTPADAQLAIAVAKKEFDEGTWPRLSGTERGRILLEWVRLIRENAASLARIESEEAGKPLAEALDDIEVTAGLTEHAGMLATNVHGDYYSNLGSSEVGIAAREPVGVVGAIVAWNFPAVIYASKVPFALAAGCTVVAKPSELTSGTAIELSLLAYRAGVPKAALSVLTGYGPEVGQPLAESTDVDLLSFTGSTATASRLSRVDRPFPQRLSLELGGKGATIVFADADLHEAVDGAMKGFCHNQGQVCTAGTRLLVEDSIADEFVSMLATRVASLRVGDPQDPSTDLGPLIDERQADRVRGFIDRARKDGAQILPATNGSAATQLLPTFVHPVLVVGLAHDHEVFQEEIFGPVLSVITFASAEEAVALANGTTYGLANGVWTRDIRRAMKVAHSLRSGMVWINDVLSSPNALPFGGAKGSGYGREKGSEGLNEFTQLKMITMQTEDRVLKYPHTVG
jgi:betaine-aldehyde dehydrogenase